MTTPAWTETGRGAVLAATFVRLGIVAATVEHPPVFTVEDAHDHWRGLDGMHTKNLFLKDAAGALWLVALPADKRADLKILSSVLGAKRFSFASAERLLEHLGVTPGSVSPLALINDPGRQVRLALDRELAEAESVTFHPLINTATVALTQADFRRFLAETGHEPTIVTL
jgi:Ala-tRNA(Pro) deacylase